MNKMNTHVAALGGVVAILVFLQCAEAQKLHVVGDDLGWRVPQDTSAYQTWANNNNNVAVGDILTFNFQTNRHDVVEVSKQAYDSCSSSNTIGTPITNGPANITLNKAGEHYYICTFSQHCQNGQKLAINVSASPSAGALPPTATPPDAMNTPPPPSSAPSAFASFPLLFLLAFLGIAF